MSLTALPGDRAAVPAVASADPATASTSTSAAAAAAGPASTPVVAVVAFDRISPFHLSVPCVVFGDRHPEAPRFDLRVCAAEAGPLRTSAGFSLQPEHTLAALALAEIVIVPSWRDAAETPPAELLAALRAAAARGAQLVGLCLGTYVLAAAGLLDGRRVTTHWGWTADLAARYPACTVDPDVLYVEDGGVLTSAGTTAGLDCCLHLLRRRYGTAVANRIARRLVMAPHRQGGQAQFVEQPLPATPRDERLAALLDWVRGHLDQPHSLDSLAARLATSRRSLSRHFRQLTGGSVGDWLLAERLARAQQWLEDSTLPVEQIAERCGFGSPASFRLHFSRRFGIAPSAWRTQFRG